MKSDIHRSETTMRTYQLSGEDILRLLGMANGEVGRADARSVKRSVTFRVPSGGDWSGEAVEVDVDNPVTITIVTEEVKPT